MYDKDAAEERQKLDAYRASSRRKPPPTSG